MRGGLSRCVADATECQPRTSARRSLVQLMVEPWTARRRRRHAVNFDGAREAAEILGASLPTLGFATAGSFSPFGPFDEIASIINADLRTSDKDGIGRRSGCYLLLAPDSTVLYIGKATRGNLHAEVWNKLGVPVDIVGDSTRRRYPSTYWSNWSSLDESVRRFLESGAIRLAGIAVDPPELSSLLEVYLQTFAWQADGRLPILNSQIG